MPSKDKKRLIAIFGSFIILTLAVLGIAIFLIMRANPDQTSVASIAISGEITCLPKKASNSAVSTECAIGLHSDDNRYYALADLPQATSWRAGDRVNITGTLTVGDYQDYETVGLIRVISATR